MLVRVITSVVGIASMLPFFIWGGCPGAAIVFAFVCGVSVYEMLGCCGLRKNLLISIPSIIVSVLTVFVPVVFGNHYFAAAAFMIATIAAMLLYYLFIGVVMHKKVDIERLLMFFALAIYITAGFSALAMLRHVFGMWPVVFVMAVSWSTDTFAYFSGKLFGKHKLCPEISPKKTVEGAIGGAVFGLIGGIIVFLIYGRTLPFALCALPLSVISQFGDLAASVIKRRFGVKDYGKFFPGHGGVLDRFDSIIIVSISTALVFLSYGVYVWFLK